MERKSPVFILLISTIFPGALSAAQCLVEPRTIQEQSKQQISLTRSKSCSDLHEVDYDFHEADPDADADSADTQASAQQYVSEGERIEKETKAIAAQQQEKATEQQKNEPTTTTTITTLADAPIVSISKMRALIEQRFTSKNALKELSDLLALHPVIPWKKLVTLFAKYNESTSTLANAPIESISKMRALIEQHFTSENTLKELSDRKALHPVIPWMQLFALFANYVEMCTQENQSKALEIQRRFIGMYRVIDVGDLHGGIFDLLDLFDYWIERGLMRDDYTLHPYVYVVGLGDYVDRGEGGIETLAMLIHFLMKNRSQVTLIRGNHEDVTMNMLRYGLVDELKKKYTLSDTQILMLSLSYVYKTFPTALFLAGGERFVQDKISYTLHVHGMVDELLAKTMGSIMQDMTEPNKSFHNSTKCQYVTVKDGTDQNSEVAWTDIGQWCQQDQVLSEPATRVMPVEHGMQTGRYLVNQELLKKDVFAPNPQLKWIVRGHQHALETSCLFDSKTWTDIVKRSQEFPKLFADLKSGPYKDRGPFPLLEAQALLCKMYKDEKLWWSRLARVITLSAAKNVPKVGTVKVLSYCIMTPNVDPKEPWSVEIIQLPRAKPQTTTSVSASITHSTVADTTLSALSASSSSATSSTAPTTQTKVSETRLS